MGDRPRPALSPWGEGALIIPPEDLPELAEWLADLIGYRSGRPRPGSAPQGRVTERLADYARLAREGASRHAARRATVRQVPSWAGPTHPLVAQTQPAASSGEWVTTSEAAGLTGKSAEHWRQLAASGRVRAQRTAGRAWLIDRADVTARTTGGNAADGAHGRRAEQERAGGDSAA